MTTTSANTGLLPERVESAARERIAASTYQTLVFGLVDGDKSEVVAFGKLDDGKTPDGDTVYEIGSITKTFTAILLARAVLAGRVTFDTPLAQVLPDFKIPSRGGKEITLDALGTHRSGLPREPSPYDYDVAKLKAFLAGYELPRDPGAAYEYSNLGFGLLGYALAQLEHTTYGVLTDSEILKPLGMTMSSIEFTEVMRGHLAPGHDASGVTANNYDLPDAQAGAGAIRSTANDMLRYLKANMGIDQSPLAAAMELAQRPRDDMAGTMRTGLAWMTTDKGIAWHSGLTAGYRSFLGFTADRRRGIVILANTAADADDLGFATLDSNAPLVPTYKAIVLPSASLDDYVGTYRLADKFLLTVFRLNDELFVQATEQVAVAILPFAPDEFFAKGTEITMSFTRDPDGLVHGLVLHQNGDREATKLKMPEDSSEPASVDAMMEVALLNDDHTPMEFVVEVLQRIFDHDRESATRIMLSIHNHGIASCGTYPWYIATTKTAQVLEFARARRHPLRCITTPVRR